MITINKQFISYCIKNRSFIRENFPIHGGSVIQYKKTGVIDILQPSIIFSAFNFNQTQIQNDCYILPSLRELVDYCKKFFGDFSIKNKNEKCSVSIGKHDAWFVGDSEEEAFLKAIICFENKNKENF